MRLWTIQPETLYELLKTEKVVHCDPLKSEFVTECEFGTAYEWMANQMKLRVGNPPDGVKYPIWAWHTLNWKHRRPDLRRVEFRNFNEDQVCIELEIPDSDVLLSDEEMWHMVLSDAYYGDSTNEADYDVEYEWFEGLPRDEQMRIKENSWEKIFKASPPINTEWDRRGMFIQATFWELRQDQIIDARYFKRRQKQRR